MGEGDCDSGGRGPRQRHIKLIAAKGGDTTTLGSEAAVKLKNPPA